MRKFKIGERVRVKIGINMEDIEQEEFSDFIDDIKGKIVRISGFTKFNTSYPYKIEEDGGVYCWCEDDFEKITQNPNN